MGAAGGEERAGGSELGILNVVLSDEIEDVRNLRFGFREERLGTTTLPVHEETVEEDSNVRTSEFTPGSKESIGRYHRDGRGNGIAHIWVVPLIGVRHVQSQRKPNFAEGSGIDLVREE